MKLLEEWDNYERAVLPPDASSIQREECRRAFYAGAAAFMAIMTRAAGQSGELAAELAHFEQGVREVAEKAEYIRLTALAIGLGAALALRAGVRYPELSSVYDPLTGEPADAVTQEAMVVAHREALRRLGHASPAELDAAIAAWTTELQAAGYEVRGEGVH